MMTKENMSSGTAQGAHAPAKKLRVIAGVMLALLTLCLVFAAPAAATAYSVSTATDLISNISSAKDGDTIIVTEDVTLEDNTFLVISKNITITGQTSGVTISGNTTQDYSPGLLTFGPGSTGSTIKDITIKFNGTGSQTHAIYFTYGFDGSPEHITTIKNVTINGADSLETITNGFGIGSVYDAGIEYIRVEDCTFTNLAWGMYFNTLQNAIITGNTIDGTRYNGINIAADVAANPPCFNITISGNTLVNISSVGYEEDAYSSGINVGSYSHGITISGNTITMLNEKLPIYTKAEAKVGETYYGTLADAVAAANADETITLLKDVALTENLDIGKSITIDGNGKTITGAYQKQLRLWGGVTSPINVTLKKINIDGTKSYAVLVGTKANLVIDGANLTGYSAVYVSQEGTTAGVDAQGDGSTVTIQNSKLSSTNNANEDGTNSFGTVAIFANDTKIEISGSTLAAAAINNTQSIIIFGGSSEIKHTGSSVSIVNSVLDVQTADKTSIYTAGTNEQGTLTLALGEGVTSNVNPSAYIAGGMEVVQPGDKYLVQTYVDRSSSGGSSTTEPEEPEQPEEPVEPTPETPAAPGEVASSTEVTDGGDVTFETPAGEDGTAPAAADDEVKGVVLPTGTEGTVEFVPVSETPAPAGQEENTKRVFEINVPSYKKGEASVIKFQMTVAEIEADGKTAADVALWHYDEETGEWTKLVTSFIIKDGIVYFEAITNDFSPFAIIYEDEPAGDLPTDTPETPEQPEEPASPAPVLAVLAALGAAVVLRRK